MSDVAPIATDPEEPRLLDLNRVIAIKWGDKVIDPREVVYVLREDATSIFQAIVDPNAIERCPVRGWSTVGARCVRPALHDGTHEWEEPA